MYHQNLEYALKQHWDKNKVIFCNHYKNQRTVIRRMDDELGRANSYMKELHEK
jgi:hypothetical protein